MTSPAGSNAAPVADSIFLAAGFDADGLVLGSADLMLPGPPTTSPPPRLWLLRNGVEWGLLTLTNHQHYDDPHEDRPDTGSLQVQLFRFPTVDDLAAHVTSAYGPGAWHQLLASGHNRSAAHQLDDELNAAWVPLEAPRQLRRFVVPLMNLTAPVLAGCLKALGTLIVEDYPEWRPLALDAVIDTFEGSVFTVDGEAPELLPGAHTHRHPAVGALSVVAWNHRLSVVVRLSTTCVYVALAAEGETSHLPIEPIPWADETSHLTDRAWWYDTLP